MAKIQNIDATQRSLLPTWAHDLRKESFTCRMSCAFPLQLSLSFPQTAVLLDSLTSPIIFILDENSTFNSLNKYIYFLQ